MTPLFNHSAYLSDCGCVRFHPPPVQSRTWTASRSFAFMKTAGSGHRCICRTWSSRGFCNPPLLCLHCACCAASISLTLHPAGGRCWDEPDGRGSKRSWCWSWATPGTRRSDQAGLNPLMPTGRIFDVLSSFCYKLKSRLPVNISGKRVREAFSNTDAEP